MHTTLRRIAKWSATGIGVVAVATLLAFAVAWFRSDNDCAARHATAPENPMNAIVYCEFGGPDALRLEKIEKPVPAEDQVLVRVHAASVNPLDYHFMRGRPYIMRMEAGLRRPKVTRLGVDFAGTVEAVGRDVTEFLPGDEVFGGKTGAFAEYVTVRAQAVVRKPEHLTFEEAAAVPIAAITALQALRDKANVQPGQQVLINGASGGVGTFAVQLAKSFGAHVTAVCSGRNAEMVRSIGADVVIDYAKENYTQDRQRRYDAIIDMIGNHSLRANRRVLQPEGVYVMVGGPKGRWVAPMDRFVTASIYERFVPQRFVTLLARQRREDLTLLRNLIDSRKLVPVIDRRYSLTEVPEAIRYLETGRARGKVVISIHEGGAAADRSALAAALDADPASLLAGDEEGKTRAGAAEGVTR